jgi:hypothetical protein
MNNHLTLDLHYINFFWKNKNPSLYPVLLNIEIQETWIQQSTTVLLIPSFLNYLSISYPDSWLKSPSLELIVTFLNQLSFMQYMYICLWIDTHKYSTFSSFMAEIQMQSVIQSSNKFGKEFKLSLERINLFNSLNAFPDTFSPLANKVIRILNGTNTETEDDIDDDYDY